MLWTKEIKGSSPPLRFPISSDKLSTICPGSLAFFFRQKNLIGLFPSRQRRCLTPRITRPPARMSSMTASVSRVACMRLLCGAQVTPEPERGANTSLPPGPVFSTRLSARPPHNARHHPPPQAFDLHKSRRVGGRVHAVVRRAVSYCRCAIPNSASLARADGACPESGASCRKRR